MTEKQLLTKKIENAVKNLNKTHSNVISINGLRPEEEVTPDNILATAYEKLETVALMGVDKEGHYYFCSSLSSAAETLWLLEKFKNILISSVDD